MLSRVHMWAASLLVGCLPAISIMFAGSDPIRVLLWSDFLQTYGYVIPIAAIPCCLLIYEFLWYATTPERQPCLVGLSILACMLYTIAATLLLAVIYWTCDLVMINNTMIVGGAQSVLNTSDLYWSTWFLVSSAIAVTFAFNSIIQRREVQLSQLRRPVSNEADESKAEME